MGNFVDLSDEKQESKLFAVGLGAASGSGSGSAAFMAESSNNSNKKNSGTQLVLDNSQQYNQGSQFQGQQQLLAEHHQNHQHQQQNSINQISFGMMTPASSSSSVLPSNFIGKDPGNYDLGDFDQALFLYLDGQEPDGIPEQRQSSGMTPPTLNIFPSQPMHVAPSSSSVKASTGLISNSPSSTSGSKRSSEPSMDFSNNPRNDVASETDQQVKAVKREGNPNGPGKSIITIEQEGPKTPDPKTLRRLAQNREAARKSRLRKKAYIQSLESSRIRLSQVEQELLRVKSQSQGVYIPGPSFLGGDQNMADLIGPSADATMFDAEYAQWLEDHHGLLRQLQEALQTHLPENELRLYVDNCLSHYNVLMSLKCTMAKSDVFHLYSGMWMTPAERCFMWMGGFRPSHLIKILMNQVDPMTEHQVMGVCGLQQSAQEAEEALTQGLEALNRSLSEIIVSEALSRTASIGIYSGQTATAMNKLSSLEGFVRQADNLRHQIIHRLHQLLTTRQSARCFLSIAEYFHRLRTLSAVWLARPRQV